MLFLLRTVELLNPEMGPNLSSLESLRVSSAMAVRLSGSSLPTDLWYRVSDMTTAVNGQMVPMGKASLSFFSILSLNLIHPIPSSWEASSEVGGSPGEKESSTGSDGDLDGLPDEWETTYFGNLNQSHDGDFDKDGLPNLLEFAFRIQSNKPFG